VEPLPQLGLHLLRHAVGLDLPPYVRRENEDRYAEMDSGRHCESTRRAACSTNNEADGPSYWGHALLTPLPRPLGLAA